MEIKIAFMTLAFSRRLHGRTVTDDLFQTKVTAQRSAAADENPRHNDRTGQGFRSRHTNALMSGVVISDTVDPLHAIHKSLNAKHAAGELTDEQYTKKARELLWNARQCCRVTLHPTEHEPRPLRRNK